MDLEALADPLAWDIAFWAMAFDDPDYDAHALGDISVEIGAKLRALGIFGLLATGERSHLFENLERSGEYRLRYLGRVAPDSRAEHHHCVLGRLDSLLDVIAADRADLARALTELPHGDHDPRREYLADHCYARLLASLFLESSEADVPEAGDAPGTAASRYAEWLDGEPDPRLDACRALADRDRGAFTDALETLLAQRLERIEETRPTDLDDATIVAERAVFIEGLALLNIARHRSMTLRDSFALCPDSARPR